MGENELTIATAGFPRQFDKLVFVGLFWERLRNTVGEAFMPPGGETYRLYERFGENVLRYGSHEWLPYSKNAVCTKSSNSQFVILIHQERINIP